VTRFAWLVLAACGGGGGATGPVVTVLTTGGGPADFALFRLADTAPWAAATPVDGQPGVFEFAADGDYEVVTGCAGSGGTLPRAEQWRATVARSPEILSLGCSTAAIPDAGRLQLTMQQAGAVYGVVEIASGTTSPWSDTVDLTAANYDVVAVATAGVAIARGVVVGTGSATPLAFDVVAAGAPLSPLTVQVSDASDPAGSDLDVSVGLVTSPLAGFAARAPIATATLAAGSAAIALAVAPEAVLIASDVQTVTASTVDGTREVASTDLAGALAVPAPLAASFDGSDSATWTDVANTTGARISDQTFGDGAVQTGLFLANADADWLGEHGAQLAFDASYPGYDGSALGDVHVLQLVVTAAPDATTTTTVTASATR
jgi:hypothetical protein